MITTRGHQRKIASSAHPAQPRQSGGRARRSPPFGRPETSGGSGLGDRDGRPPAPTPKTKKPLWVGWGPFQRETPFNASSLLRRGHVSRSRAGPCGHGATPPPRLAVCLAIRARERASGHRPGAAFLTKVKGCV
jgi:hypothetical protein